MPDGSIMPAREMARQEAEQLKTGGILVFPSTTDETGNYVWNYQPPNISGNATEIREYPKDLDNEIFRGLGIPDNVIMDAPGTGSYAGRRVPERAYYVRLEMVVHEIMNALKNQVLDVLVAINFEGVHDYEIITKPIIEIMSPEGTPNLGPGGAPSEGGDNMIGSVFAS
jgi:hypothetical protein